MIELSIALIIIAGIAGYLCNKFLDQRQQELDESFKVNTVSTINVDTSAATEEKFNQFDSRINQTWGTISSVKLELEALKLQIGLKGNR